MKVKRGEEEKNTIKSPSPMESCPAQPLRRFGLSVQPKACSKHAALSAPLTPQYGDYLSSPKSIIYVYISMSTPPTERKWS